MDTALPEVSVIIVTWNGLAYLDACLAGVAAQRELGQEGAAMSAVRRTGAAEGVAIGVVGAVAQSRAVRASTVDDLEAQINAVKAEVEALQARVEALESTLAGGPAAALSSCEWVHSECDGQTENCQVACPAGTFPVSGSCSSGAGSTLSIDRVSLVADESAVRPERAGVGTYDSWLCQSNNRTIDAMDVLCCALGG